MSKALPLILVTSLFVSVLCNVVVAQEYFVRPRSVTNLRAEPNLDSSVIETARAGQILNVMGEEGDWLRIRRNGHEAWMANWVEYDVFGKDGQLEMTSRFADMNCDKLPKYIGDGGWSWVGVNCELDLRPPEVVLPRHVLHIPVKGPEASVESIDEALNQLMADAPEWYTYLILAVDEIVVYAEGSSHDYNWGTAHVNPASQTVYMNRYAATGRRELVVGVLVHEACHIYVYKAGLRVARHEEELICHAAELYALEAIGASDRKRSYPAEKIEFLLFLGE